MFVASDKNNESLIVKDRKGFIKIALETGTQVIPIYTFGNSQTFESFQNKHLEKVSRYLRMSLIGFWGRYGLPIPFRTPLVTVLGRPIQCPKVINPTPELINEYHELYLKELRRIYDKFKNVYGWQNKPLVYKR